MTDNLPQKPEQPKEQGVLAIINSKAMKEQFRAALPKHMSEDRMVRLFTTIYRRTPKLMRATQESLLGALMTCSQLGLEPEPALGHIYLIPFEEKVKDKNGRDVLDANRQPVKEMRVQTIIGYRGMIDLARRTGQVASVCARVVHENDEFRYVLGLVEELHHIPTIKGDPGQPIGAYAVWRFKDGSTHSEFMSKHEIMAIARRSKSYYQGKFSGPWATDELEMWKKTVLRRSFKMVPVSVEIERNLLNEKGITLADVDDNAIDAEYTIGEQEQIQIEAPAAPENIRKPEPPQAQPAPEKPKAMAMSLPPDHPLNPDVMAQVGPESLPEYVHANYGAYINLDSDAQAEVRRAFEFLMDGKPFQVYIQCPESDAWIAKAACSGCLKMECPTNPAKPKAGKEKK